MGLQLTVYFALSVALAIPTVAWPLAATGRNGISEFYLRFALGNYSGLTHACLHVPQCREGLDSAMVGLEDSGLYNTTSFNFLTARELGNHLYRLDAGGVVAINRDMLFIGRNGGLEPYLYADAVDLLAQVWGGRLRWDESRTRLFAYRMREMAVQGSERMTAPEFYLSQFSFSLIRVPSTALIIEDTHTHDLATTIQVPFETQLSCSTSTGVETPLRNLKITTVKWERSSNLSFRHALLSLQGTLSYGCPQSNGRQTQFASNFVVQIDIHSRQGVWYLNTNSLRIQQNSIRVE
ncbi:MAG: hypothetical protein KF799_16445 [Bdellovibrionales bacterium]|nr:hypothetical protein [Bdellovibrionales bacterium]